jgi:hypothetical protein
MDAVLFGTKASVEDAFRFARGGPVLSPGGEPMQLSRPLDFVAITDHAEGFGLRTRCDEDDLSLLERVNCWLMRTPGWTTAFFLASRETRMGIETDPAWPAGVYRNRARDGARRADVPICSRGQGGPARCDADSRAAWQRSAITSSPTATTSPA